MRLRGIKGIREALEQQPDLVVLNPKDYKGSWAKNYFKNDHPIHVELGMGKGQFISELSLQNPDINFIGIDMYDELVRKASIKARRSREDHASASLANLALALLNIEHILEAFAQSEIARIYLNFSDPWPKNRHARRRLTHEGFIKQYIHLLNEQGQIHLKTDSQSLFEFSLNTFADLGLRMRNISLHLHSEGLRHDLVMTEYETKFAGQGMPIYRCEIILGEHPNQTITAAKRAAEAPSKAPTTQSEG
ncbi:MAG: tRNA -methyltransferase [Bacilli bacterium]|nr:tRNA -methyltransferase [Bacilli bacterium]